MNPNLLQIPTLNPINNLKIRKQISTSQLMNPEFTNLPKIPTLNPINNLKIRKQLLLETKVATEPNL
jgi:hypothetical protein